LHDVEWRRWAWRAIPLALIVGPPVCLFGCTSPVAPPPAPSGGQQIVMSFSQFQSTVEPVLIAKGCDATADCHGGGIRGTFQLSPPSAKDVHFDFDQASLQVWSRTRLEPDPEKAVGARRRRRASQPVARHHVGLGLAIRAWVDSGVVQ
jgi:hypothetical protein